MIPGNESGTIRSKTQDTIKKFMVVSLIILIVGTAFLVIYTQTQPLPLYEPLPPSDNVPGTDPI